MSTINTGKVFGLQDESDLPELIIPFEVSIHTCTKCNHSFITPKESSRIVTPDEPKIITP